MVADTVEVLSRRAGEEMAWRWTSDGQGQFTIGEAEKDGRGTRITLHIKKDAKEFLETTRLRHVATTYSDHISLPIKLVEDDKADTINQASALWTRQKKDISDEQYTEFYRHVGHTFDEPWLTLHWRAEGKIEYTSLLFLPTARPLDLFNSERRHKVKLYVRRVFITDECEDLVPPWLRFLNGLVDSEDLPLNVSREMLQNNPTLTRIRAAIIKRVLSELKKKAEKKSEEYTTFWDNFGAVLKEGLYEDQNNRDTLLNLVRFRSTAGDDLVGLETYVERMKPGQEAIYYITGDEVQALSKSPQLEGFRARGIEVLLMTDPVDEFWIPSIDNYEKKSFKSATRAGADLSDIKHDGAGEESKNNDATNKEHHQGLDSLIAMVKLELGDAVKDVRPSERLTDSPVCLVADEGDMDIHLERLLRQHKQIDQSVARVMEINPTHSLITTLCDLIGDDGAGTKITEASWLLLDQARIIEGETLPDPVEFTKRLSEVMTRSLSTS